MFVKRGLIEGTVRRCGMLYSKECDGNERVVRVQGKRRSMAYMQDCLVA